MLIISAEPEVIDLVLSLNKFRLAGVADKNSNLKLAECPVVGTDKAAVLLMKKNKTWRAVLALDPPALKEKLAHAYGLSRLETLRAPDSYVSVSARIGIGSIVQRGVKIMPRAKIGLGCKLNIDAVVHHDCVVGDYSTVAPGARLLGSVQVGRGVFIGAGALVLPHVKIGSGAVVGAGAVVVKDVTENETVAGVPARPLRPRK